MTLSFYKECLQSMIDEQEKVILNHELSNHDLAIEAGLLAGIELCLEKAHEIE